MNHKTGRIFAACEIALGVIFAVAMRTFLAPCGPKEDGTFMHCHTAGQALFVIALLLTVCGICGLILKGRAGIVSAAAGILFSAAAFLLPGRIISLCMMPDMRCRAVMQPGAFVFAVLHLILFAAHLAVFIRGKRS